MAEAARKNERSAAADEVDDGAAHDGNDAAAPRCAVSNVTAMMTRSVENAFFRLGCSVAHHPWRTIGASVIFFLACSGGLLLWHNVTESDVLWTPYGSAFEKEREWIKLNFRKDTRHELLILASEDNAVSPENIQYLWRIHAAIADNSTTADGSKGYSDLCVPDLETAKEDDCFAMSILRLWNNDPDVINNLSRDKISDDLTRELRNAGTLFRRVLSNVTYDADGRVATVGALFNIWLIKFNDESVTGEKASDPVAEDWENSFINVVIDSDNPALKPEGTSIYYSSEKSFLDEIDASINDNLIILFIGSALIFLYIAMVLGRFNSVEQRVLLSVLGLTVIGFGVASSFGMAFYVGLFFAPHLHPIIPFLLLGIGVDNMFIIVQALDNLKSGPTKLLVDRRIAQAMKHAGVSITVTSITNMSVFLIGSTSVMPIMRHFCLFTALGILMLYLLSITFFLGCLVLDERRIDRRQGSDQSIPRSVCPCAAPRSKAWKPGRISRQDYGKWVFENVVTKVLVNNAVKAGVLLGIVGICAFGVYGATQIEAKYDPRWYLRPSSYQAKFLRALGRHFPDEGVGVEIYVGEIKYWEHLDEMYAIGDAVKNNSYTSADSVNYWFTQFYDGYCGQEENSTFVESPDSAEDEFWSDFGDGSPADTTCEGEDCTSECYFKYQFLNFLNENRRFYPDFRFSQPLEKMSYTDLLAGAFEIKASRATLKHIELNGRPRDQAAAVATMKADMKGITFAGENFSSPLPYSFHYVPWEAQQMVAGDLTRNLGFSFATIVVITLILIADLSVSIVVLFSVIMTVANVAGFSHFCGLTIEITSSVVLILCVGLGLDYSAHIGVAYLASKKATREERAKDSLTAMGPAVFHGGFSTFLAFALTYMSDSYFFIAFATMFGFVVLFGLLHALFFLPICLSIAGPLNSEENRDPQEDGENGREMQRFLENGPENDTAV